MNPENWLVFCTSITVGYTCWLISSSDRLQHEGQVIRGRERGLHSLPMILISVILFLLSKAEAASAFSVIAGMIGVTLGDHPLASYISSYLKKIRKRAA